MRKSLWIMLALLVVGAAQVASADSTESFNFSGTLTSGVMGNDSVTGTFTLDFTTTSITAFDFTTPLFTVDANNGFDASLFTFTPAVSPNTDFVDLFFSDADGDFLTLLFQTNLTSFSGNTFFTSGIEPAPGEGDISTLSCGGITCGLTLDFTSGSATPITTAPEPSSVALMLLGVGLVFVLRKRNSRDHQLAA